MALYVNERGTIIDTTSKMVFNGGYEINGIDYIGEVTNTEQTITFPYSIGSYKLIVMLPKFIDSEAAIIASSEIPNAAGLIIAHPNMIIYGIKRNKGYIRFTAWDTRSYYMDLYTDYANLTESDTQLIGKCSDSDFVIKIFGIR